MGGVAKGSGKTERGAIRFSLSVEGARRVHCAPSRSRLGDGSVPRRAREEAAYGGVRERGNYAVKAEGNFTPSALQSPSTIS